MIRNKQIIVILMFFIKMKLRKELTINIGASSFSGLVIKINLNFVNGNTF